jgi:hypothetical protein
MRLLDELQLTHPLDQSGFTISLDETCKSQDGVEQELIGFASLNLFFHEPLQEQKQVVELALRNSPQV